jgi:hypothetical protein
MPIPNFNLAAGQFLATQSSSVLGIEIQSQGYLFATVDDVYEGSDFAVAGQSVIFREKDAIKMKYGSTIYYLLSETDIKSTEIPLP